MILETWRVRIVFIIIGSILIAIGGYCLFNPGEFPLNLCDAPGSKFLHFLNEVFTVVTYLIMVAGGAFMYWIVFTSIRDRLGTEPEPVLKKIPLKRRIKHVVVILTIVVILLILMICLDKFLENCRFSVELPKRPNTTQKKSKPAQFPKKQAPTNN